MIQTISKMIVKQGKVDEFISIFKEMIEPTKDEQGCIQYEMYQDEDNPALLIVLEQWNCREDFDRHLESEHFKKIAPKMVALLSEETDLNIARLIA